jgi:hypothetical protein
MLTALADKKRLVPRFLHQGCGKPKAATLTGKYRGELAGESSRRGLRSRVRL